MLELDPGVMIWAWITFFVLLFCSYKLAWKPILSTIDKREKTIQDSLDRAEKAKEEAETLLEQHNQVDAIGRRRCPASAQRKPRTGRKITSGDHRSGKRSADKLSITQKLNRKRKEDALGLCEGSCRSRDLRHQRLSVNHSMNLKQRAIVSDYIRKMPDQPKISWSIKRESCCCTL